MQALENNADDYQYFKAVQFVKRVKKGPLQETSPLLNDISGVPTWEKVMFTSTALYAFAYGFNSKKLVIAASWNPGVNSHNVILLNRHARILLKLCVSFDLTCMLQAQKQTICCLREKVDCHDLFSAHAGSVFWIELRASGQHLLAG